MRNDNRRSIQALSGARLDGNWVRANMRVVNGEWEYIPDDERPDFRTDFWVDVCHGGNVMVDERYYFPDLASALDFYLDGWNERQYLHDDGTDVGARPQRAVLAGGA